MSFTDCSCPQTRRKLRVCVDLRALNSNIVVDCHPLPNINKVVSMFEGAQIFSTLDLHSAYHQIELMDESKKYTAFITPFGLYQYTRMPFGPASAASAFQSDVPYFQGCRRIRKVLPRRHFNFFQE